MKNIYFHLPAPESIEDAYALPWTVAALPKTGGAHYYGRKTFSEILPIARELRRSGAYLSVTIQCGETIVAF